LPGGRDPVLDPGRKFRNADYVNSAARSTPGVGGRSAFSGKLNELIMTQELVASMLGVRREGITEAAGKLQQAGCIRYRRGHMAVLDRSILETRACECYAVVKKELDRLLSDVRYRQGIAAVV
jgi:hypothetical protein